MSIKIEVEHTLAAVRFKQVLTGIRSIVDEYYLNHSATEALEYYRNKQVWTVSTLTKGYPHPRSASVPIISPE